MTPSQLSISFDDPLNGKTRRNGPRSSVEAARTCNANAQRQQILRLLAANTQGLTADELAGQMHPVPHRSSVAARLAQLADVKNGSLVYTFGVRRNRSNRPVQVWFLRYSSRVVDVATGGRL